MGRVIVITSGKGGVGKTTVTANLGAALAALDKKILIIDMDIGLRNLDVVLGMENRVVYDIVDVLEGKCRLRQALIRDKRLGGLNLLPASQVKEKSALNEKQMIELMDELKRLYDYVLLDSPAGIEQGFKNAAAGAEEAIIVTMPEVSAVRDADRVAGLLLSGGLPNPYLVINRMRRSLVRKGDMLDVQDTLDILGLPLLGVLADDESIVRATNLGEPVILHNDGPASRVFRQMARTLEGAEQTAEKSRVRDAVMRFFGLQSRIG